MKKTVGEGSRSRGGGSTRKVLSNGGKGMKGKPISLRAYFRRYHLGFVLQAHAGSYSPGYGKGGLMHSFQFTKNGKKITLRTAGDMADYLLEQDTRLPAKIQETSKGSVSKEKMRIKISRVICDELKKNGFGLYTKGKRKPKTRKPPTPRPPVAAELPEEEPELTTRQGILAEYREAGAKKVTMPDGTIVEF
jgi:hypothetical protein